MMLFTNYMKLLKVGGFNMTPNKVAKIIWDYSENNKNAYKEKGQERLKNFWEYIQRKDDEFILKLIEELLEIKEKRGLI